MPTGDTGNPHRAVIPSDATWDELLAVNPAYARLGRWIDRRLRKLETRWAHMSTVHALRRDWRQGRGTSTSQ